MAPKTSPLVPPSSGLSIQLQELGEQDRRLSWVRLDEAFRLSQHANQRVDRFRFLINDRLFGVEHAVEHVAHLLHIPKYRTNENTSYTV
jgi:hypothetical protein